LEVIPIADCNPEVDIQSPAPGWPAKNVAKHDFPGSGARKKICRFMFARYFSDFLNRLEDDWIDPIIPDF